MTISLIYFCNFHKQAHRYFNLKFIMVRKRGPFDRIEKVVQKKRSLNLTEENSDESPSKKDKNVLNDHILSLYKKEASSVSMNRSSSEKNDQPTSDVIVLDKQIENAALTSTSFRKSSSKHAKKMKYPGFSVKHPTVGFKDVAGLHEILTELSLECSRIRDTKYFSEFDEDTGDYIILSGPPGCGKTHVVRAVAGESGFPLLEVAATSLVCGTSGESESKIRDLFEEAARVAPCILFIDKIDVIAPKIDLRDNKSMEKPLNQLLESLDDFKANGHASNVVVIVATKKLDDLDLDLLSRFECKLTVEIPDEKARLMILQVLTKNWNVSPDFNLKWIAHHTPGYVGADLHKLVKKALKLSIKRSYTKYIKTHLDVKKCEPNSHNANNSNSLLNEYEVMSYIKSDFEIPVEEAVKARNLKLEYFQEALKTIIPYSKQEGFYEVPEVTWEDVGALDDVKQKIKENFIWPIKHRKIYEDSGIQTSKGILLYGPKGCGKTLLAKVLANESSINFLSVKGPELLNMYLGESERAVRQCFQKARDCAPCVIFFDEIDSLFPKRSGTSTNAAADRVVNQLLTLMDGTDVKKEVFVMGATNRLEILDSAVLRPGRLDKVFYVGLPTPAGRADILKSLTKNKTKPKISDDVDLKAIGHDTRCANFSGADLNHLVQAAGASALRELIGRSESTMSEPNGVVEITLQDFENAFNEVKPSVTEQDLRTFGKRTRHIA